tara:strand:+ start:1089 stop:1955 length:867 start_codon:yes stop_codon:yes gene_type:complete
MATLNLGRLKPVFRGSWNSATAYNVDDIVVRTNQSYISIQAGTNQDPATATAYWTLMAAAGTDVAAALANKEIAFKTNAGAVDGIPIGNSGEFLKVNSGATGYEFAPVVSKVLGQKLVQDQTGINMGNINRSMYNITQLGLTYTTQSTSSYFVVRCHIHLANSNHQKASIEWSKDNSNWYHPSEAGNAGFDASAYTPSGAGINWSSEKRYQYPQMGVAPYTDPNRHEPSSCAFVLTPSSTHSASTMYLRVGSFVSNDTADAMYNRTNGNSGNDGSIAQSSIEIVEYKL